MPLDPLLADDDVAADFGFSRRLIYRLHVVIRQPMPSMPVGFWGDTDGSRYRAAYSEQFPGVWRHDDWIEFAGDGNCVIVGRSDATLIRGGVRIGTAEFYRVLDELDDVVDSLVVHLEDAERGPGELVLFIVPSTAPAARDGLVDRVRMALRKALSPRHQPDLIQVVHAVPRMRTGKKLEIPVKRILQGLSVDAVANRDALEAAGPCDP